MSKTKSGEAMNPAGVTADEFRRLALTLPGTHESAHMGHPDFRTAGRIFATLGSPGPEWGMVQLTPAQQSEFMTAAPDVFVPAKGAWGRGGSTTVRLASVRSDVLQRALLAAWQNRQKPKKRTGT